jgi:predicted PurR-regulated permease PerM
VSETAVRKVWILPGFTAILVTILLLWLAGTVADLLLLLFLGILLAVYLSALTDLIVAKTRLPRGPAFSLGILLSLGALFGIGALLIPPVVEQTRQLLTVLPTIVSEWERGLERFLAAIPGMDDVLVPGEHRIFAVALEEAQRLVGALVPRLFDTLHLGVNLVAVIVMAIYFALRPDIYRDLAVSLTPPKHRDAAAEIILALNETLRAWTIAQLLAMVTLAALTAIGLWILDVPYWLAFGIFTGLVAVVPFFGTFVSTLVPALFVLPGEDGGIRALLVILLGSIIHIVENQLVVPLLMHKKVDLPPVLTIMSVLICGKLLGPFGLVVSVPMLAVMMVLVRRVLIARVYKDEVMAPAVVTPVLTRKQRKTLQMRQTAEMEAAAAARGPSTDPADAPSNGPKPQ